MPDPRALHLVARSLGVTPEQGCECAVCGESPYLLSGRSVRKTFADWDFLRGHERLCDGCEAIMGGKPGRQPPPLRTISFVADGERLQPLDRAGMWPLLRRWPVGTVVSWARSRQKHHVLSAGVVTEDELPVGSDHGTVRVRRPDLVVLSAVERLLSVRCFSRAEIVTGRYRADRIAAFGVTLWRDLERVVAQYRGRGIVDLACWCAPGSEHRPEQQRREQVLPRTDLLAVDLLGAIARASERRRNDGLAFWGGWYQRRVDRFARLPLADCVSRLLGECAVPPSSDEAQLAARLLAELSDADTEAISAALRSRSQLLIALAFDRRKKG